MLMCMVSTKGYKERLSFLISQIYHKIACGNNKITLIVELIDGKRKFLREN